MLRDYVCPNGPSCPDPQCRQDRADRGLPVAPPVVNTRDCAHNAMIPNNDPQFAWKCADCGRIYGEDISSVATGPRCRYEDCCKGYPVAAEHEQVTCPVCREDLGLPPLSEDTNA